MFELFGTPYRIHRQIDPMPTAAERHKRAPASRGCWLAMIDTPQNCRDRAAFARAAAVGPMLENERRRHLSSAAAWENLAQGLQGQFNDSPSSPKPPAAKIRANAQVAGFTQLSQIAIWENEGGTLGRVRLTRRKTIGREV